MFYGECYKCGERWELGTASTCKCEVGMTFDASAPVTITSHPYFYKRPWVGLTDEDEIAWDGVDAKSFAKAIEAKLKEKNNG
jgi:hypothetical protein